MQRFAPHLLFGFWFVLQPIEGLSNTDNFLKVPLCGTFKKLSEFYGSAR
jgi:hypothetical protein